MMPNDPSTETQTPAQRAEIWATLACLASLIGLFMISRPVLEFLRVWWAGLLFYPLVPIALTFAILHRSCVHREMGRVVRVLFLLGNAVLIFGGLCLAAVIIAFSAVALLPLSRFHY
jgi:hypothetical protein